MPATNLPSIAANASPDMVDFLRAPITELPILSVQQLQLLHEVHKRWRAQGRHPLVSEVRVRLRKEMDFEAVRKSIHWQLLLRDGSGDNEFLRLRVPGLALCPGESASIRAYLGLHRLAARRVIAAPTKQAEITDRDLQKLLRGVPKRQVDLVSPLIREDLAWGGSYKPTGKWNLTPGVGVVRYEKLRTINEYLRLRAGKPQPVQLLQAAHLSLLRAIYGVWRRSGSWPKAPGFLVRYRKRGDAFTLLSEMPTRYRLDAQWESHEPRPIALTLDGIAWTRKADADLAAFVKLVGALIRKLDATPHAPHMTLTELAKSSHVDAPVVQRLAELLQSERRLGVELRRETRPWSVKIRDLILAFEDIGSIEDYFARRDSLVGRDVMSGDAASDQELRGAILEIYAGLPKGKSENRYNVLGRSFQPGRLEDRLKRAFTTEERARAAKIMKQLEAEDLLFAPGSALMDPADWLSITPKGIEAMKTPPSGSPPASLPPSAEFDAFLCHASEDKASIVTPFAELMKGAGLRPWLDASQVAWGDSLVGKVEHGLSKSRFVIVFVSAAFLKKDWPEKELRSALTMEIDGKKKVLPVLLGVSKEDVQGKHPFLTEKLYKVISPYDPAVPVEKKHLEALLQGLKEVLASA